MNALDLECLTAAIGVDKVLFGKPSLFKYQVLEAAGMPKEMRSRILKFLATDDMEPGRDTPEFDYDAVKELVSHGLSPEQQSALQVAVPDPDMAQEIGTEISRIVAWANTVLPRETRNSIAGAVDETPDPGRLGDFARLWQVATDPMSALDEMAEGCLSDDQVAALATCWPALYDEMKQAVSDSVATMRGRRRTWEPTAAKGEQAATLMQRDDFDAELAGAIQQVYAAEAQQQAGPPKPKQPPDADDVDDSLTPGQRAAG